MLQKQIFFLSLMLIVIFISCSKDEATQTNSTGTTNTTAVPEVFKNIYGATSITSDGTYHLLLHR